MPIKADPLLSETLREQLTYALRPDTGSGVGTTDIKTPLDTSDGVEFEIGSAGGVYIGTVPYAGETPVELPYSEIEVTASGILYVYVADLDAKKRETGGERAATYAALQYESELFRALSKELRTLIRDIFSIDADTIRFERCDDIESSGAYFILPINTGWT